MNAIYIGYMFSHSHSIDDFVTELDTCECRKFPFIVDADTLLPVLCYAKYELQALQLMPSSPVHCVQSVCSAGIIEGRAGELYSGRGRAE